MARTQPLALTAFGVQYLGIVRQALTALDALPRTAPRGSSRRLRVAVPPTFARNMLVPNLGEFTAAYPQVELELQLTIPLLDVRAGEADVEVRFGRRLRRHRRTVTPLLDEPVFPVIAPSCVARVGPFTSPAELERVPTAAQSPRAVATWFRRPASTGPSRARVSSTTTSAC